MDAAIVFCQDVVDELDRLREERQQRAAVAECEAIAQRAEELLRPEYRQLLSTRITRFNMSDRTARLLHASGVEHFGQLVRLTEAQLLATRNFGRKHLKEVKAVLAHHELQLGLPIDDWTP